VVGVHFGHKQISDPNQLAVFVPNNSQFLSVAGIHAADVKVFGVLTMEHFAKLLFLSPIRCS
jgi:hypothetical protein